MNLLKLDDLNVELAAVSSSLATLASSDCVGNDNVSDTLFSIYRHIDRISDDIAILIDKMRGEKQAV